MELIKVAGIINDSIVDGPGIRLTIFTQGCYHHCQGCHNPHTHDIKGGFQIEIENIIKMIDDNPLLSGITFLEGNQYCNGKNVLSLPKQQRKED